MALILAVLVTTVQQANPPVVTLHCWVAQVAPMLAPETPVAPVVTLQALLTPVAASQAPVVVTVVPQAPVETTTQQAATAEAEMLQMIQQYR
jgi:hypothetical protein